MMAFFMLVIPAIIIVLAVRYFGAAHPEPNAPQTALETLKIRYAKGEITKEEFDKVRAELL